MGTFAVLKPMQGGHGNIPSEAAFSVQRMDINLWILPSLIGRYTLVCDVGLKLTAGTKSLEALDVSLPFRVAEAPPRDLAPILLARPDTANLLFGEDVSKNKELDYHRLVPVRFTSNSSMPAQSDQDGPSTVHVIPKTAIAAGDSAYIRFRVDISDPQRAVAWRRARRRGCILDLRVGDLREISFVPEDLRHEERIVLVEKVNCLVVAPAYLRAVRVHPGMHAVRILEGRPWEHYLQRALDLFRRNKYVVHFWRQEPKGAFRGFLELSRRGEQLSMPLLSGLVAAVLVWLSVGWNSTENSPIRNLIESIGSTASTLWEQYAVITIALTGTAIGALIYTFVYIFVLGRKFPGWARKLGRRLRALDSWIYRTAGRTET